MIPMGYTPGSYGNRMTEVHLQAGEQSQDRSNLAPDGMFRMGAVPAAGGEYTLQASPNEMMGQPWAPSAPITVTLGTEMTARISNDDGYRGSAARPGQRLVSSAFISPARNTWIPCKCRRLLILQSWSISRQLFVDSVQVVYQHVILQLQHALSSTDRVSVTYNPGTNLSRIWQETRPGAIGANRHHGGSRTRKQRLDGRTHLG